MATFKPRLTAPAKTNKNYYSDKNIFYACGYGMPNCTAYAWGRLLELTGKSYDKLCGNAEDWWAVAEKAGLKRGNTPKLGAIVCWKAGKVKNSSDGAGHVAVVEEVKNNGDIVVSNSAWKGTEFYLMTITKASGYVYNASRQLQGFIYCGVEFDTQSSTSSASYQCIHIVITGDTLWRLAEKYLGKGNRYPEIMELNGLKDTTIYYGQKLKIPFKDKPSYQCIHTVVKGDTLWKLAEKYLGKGKRYSEIMSLNGLTSDVLSVGQKLRIPTK